ncbi:MAG TPA: hypothetical protein ENI23_03130 [bacterium]|nr:hypothetical protein [bacterium]
MKPCCKKWKEAVENDRVMYRETGCDIEYLSRLAPEFSNHCPNCGSSLKEEINGDCLKCKRAAFCLRQRTTCNFQPKQESKWCECEEPFEAYKLKSKYWYCGKCSKPINPTPKLPEKIEWGEDEPVGLMQDTINQILDYLKTKGGE